MRKLLLRINNWKNNLFCKIILEEIKKKKIKINYLKSLFIKYKLIIMEQSDRIT